MEIGALYYDLWDNYSQSTILDRAGEGLIYNINGVEWERREDSKVTLEGRLTQPIWTDHISVDYVSGDSVDDLKVEILSNGIWQEPSEVLQYGAIGHYYLDTVAAAEGIRLIYERTENDNQWNVNFIPCLSYEEDNKNFAALPVASGTGDYLDKLETDDAAFDNDVTTRWSVAQDPGREYRIELEESTSLRGLQLILGTSNYDWPRALQIFTSVDGINWTEVSFTSRLNADICFDNAVECRYVRLVLGGTAQEVTNNWSIHEIILYRQNQ